MARCEFCEQEMVVGVGCALPTFRFADGSERPRIPYGAEWAGAPDDWPWSPCHDCGVTRGQLHHYGCDAELCPRCGGQALGCACFGEATPVEPWKLEPYPAYCADCGEDVWALGETYMVRDEAWPIDPDGGQLCVGCLEKRLGRELRPEDFLDVPLGRENPSERLRARRGDAAP
jgi:hypothetical protein